MNLSPYERLANAIVMQAVTDYRNARKTLKIRPKSYKLPRWCKGSYK